MIQSELNKILDKHIKWLNGEEGGEKADLCYVDLCYVDLSYTDLRYANLSYTVLRSADLRYADLRGAVLRGADLRNADLSGALGLQSSLEFMEKNFQKTQEGYIVYKAFGAEYKTPEYWEITENSVLTENVNSNRTETCGCGINVAPLKWIQDRYPNKTIYKLLIKWEWLPGVTVPYNSDGQIRCEKALILGKVDENEMV